MGLKPSPSEEEEESKLHPRGVRQNERVSKDEPCNLCDQVWITKYRKKVLSGKIGESARELFQQVCKESEVEILSGHVCVEGVDHIYLLVLIPPYLSASKRI